MTLTHNNFPTNFPFFQDLYNFFIYFSLFFTNLTKKKKINFFFNEKKIFN